MEGEYNDCKFMTFNDLDCSSLQQLVQWALSLHTHSHIICVILKNNGLKSAFTVTLLKYFQKYLLAVYELQAFQVSFSRPFLFLSHNFNFNKFQAYLIFFKVFLVFQFNLLFSFCTSFSHLPFSSHCNVTCLFLSCSSISTYCLSIRWPCLCFFCTYLVYPSNLLPPIHFQCFYHFSASSF